MIMKFFWDEFENRFGKGNLRKRCEISGFEGDYENPYWKYLYTALSYDANDASYCEKILVAIAKVERREIEKTSWTGNAFITDIYRDRVEIDHQQFGGEPEWPMWICTLAEFKTALEGWKRFLEMPVSLESQVTVELPNVS